METKKQREETNPHKIGPKYIWNSPGKLQVRIDEYFESLKDKVKTVELGRKSETKLELYKDAPPTYIGLAAFVGLSNLESLNNQLKRTDNPEIVDVFIRAMTKIQQDTIEGAAIGKFVGAAIYASISKINGGILDFRQSVEIVELKETKLSKAELLKLMKEAEEELDD